MSDFNDFLREAKAEVSAAKFERDVEAGLITDLENGRRLRFVGNPSAPLCVNVGFKSIAAWRADCAMMPKGPPVIHDLVQVAGCWTEVAVTPT
jgi:hypothetical protein